MAEREIDTAISLLLDGGDPIAIHVLTMAAHDIVESAARLAGVSTPWEEHVNEMPVELREPYRAAIRGPSIFMKHGGGREGTLEHFMPDAVHLYLVSTVSAFHEVFGHETKRMPDFWMWILEKRPRGRWLTLAG